MSALRLEAYVSPEEQAAAHRVLDHLTRTPAFQRGQNDAYQDQCEGCPNASIGARDCRGDLPGGKPQVPSWIRQEAVQMRGPRHLRDQFIADYLRGYDHQMSQP